MTEETISERLYREYITKYIDKITKLDTHPDFIRNDAVRKRETKSHIMYKLKRNPLSQSLDFLFDSNASEKKYKYEFLVEFDKETPGYGIYYGCRAIIDESITSEEELIRQIDLIEEDMIPIKEKASEVLNKVFVSKKFNEQSFRKTNNANENTYWPFWIALSDEEDIWTIAAQATKLIANTYLTINTEQPLFKFSQPKYEKEHNLCNTVQTRFTFDALQKLLKKLKTTDKQDLFLDFIIKAEKKGFLTRNSYYEFAWDLSKSGERNKGAFNGAVKILLEKLDHKGEWNLVERIILQGLKQNLGKQEATNRNVFNEIMDIKTEK